MPVWRTRKKSARDASLADEACKCTVGQQQTRPPRFLLCSSAAFLCVRPQRLARYPPASDLKAWSRNPACTQTTHSRGCSGKIRVTRLGLFLVVLSQCMVLLPHLSDKGRDVQALPHAVSQGNAQAHLQPSHARGLHCFNILMYSSSLFFNSVLKSSIRLSLDLG